MPIYEHACCNPECPRHMEFGENYFPSASSEMPMCECGQRKRKAVSSFAVPFMRPLGEYGDKNKEGYYQGLEGHTVYRKRSGGGTENAPVKEFITTVQQQRRYCKEEGLYTPDEVGPCEVHSDGVGMSSRGLRGCW